MKVYLTKFQNHEVREYLDGVNAVDVINDSQFKVQIRVSGILIRDPKGKVLLDSTWSDLQKIRSVG